MLELKKITKIYQTESLKQKALDNITLNFRDCEFASILGPSGSGKTTLLNIIGGLDNYTSGDLIINEVSTKKYKDRDWDSYRNHRVGFVFQSYNLISHQSILANVELALTLTGVSKKQRIKLAKQALQKVGLEKHIYKKPNQLSGGQMQRVAIARALVNNPDIILADEPTGALDSETSKQILELLKEVSKEKLVIMVTHNDELATDYSTRIIKLKDGNVIDDTNPYDGKVNTKDIEKEKQKSKKTSMSFKTALSLSLNNLITKKGRTILIAFAGSIGIIGIALILSLSNGVHEYINRTEKETLSSYPLSIESTTMDFSNISESNFNNIANLKCDSNSICTLDDISLNPEITMAQTKKSNVLSEFKKALDNNFLNINDYVMDIKYKYDLDLQIYSSDISSDLVKVNPYSLILTENNMMDMWNSMSSSMNSIMSSVSLDVFKELIENKDLLDSQYDLLSGRFPEKYDEVILIVNKDKQIALSTMYALDVEDRKELGSLIKDIKDNKIDSIESINYEYDNLIGKTFKLILNTDYYAKENGIWINKSLDNNYMKNVVENGQNLKIVGVAKVADDAIEATSGYIGYTNDLAKYVIEKINQSDIVKEQISNPNKNVLTGMEFGEITYEKVLNVLGVCDLESPYLIELYPKDFNSKEEIENIIIKYNEEQKNIGKSENEIVYTDYVGILLSGITSIIDVITYILIAFVAISLIVSSIMIAVITYISVLERTKEIGILRAIGASKKDIRRVFNAETVIEGFISGVFGITITLILCIPINKIVFDMTEVANIAALPTIGAIVLIIISVVLNLIAGLVPANMASKKDPVVALRTE